jgi:glycosyltransferase involved in cell wall biosynthesis
MNNPPKVTIAIPVYNGEKYIGKAIESVLNQTYTDFCLTIFDNDSSDNTRQVCEQYQDERVKYFKNEQNIGMGGNHNRSLEHCDSPYFKWLSHDDMLAPTYLEKCLELLESDSSLGIAHSKTKNIDQDGNTIGDYDHEISLNSTVPSDRFRRLLWMDFIPEIHGVMRTEFLKRTVGYGSFPGADRNCLGHMILLGNVGYVDQYLFYYRTHSQNYSLANKSNLDKQKTFTPEAKGLRDYLKANAASLIKWQVYAKSITSSNLSLLEQVKCLICLGEWFAGRAYEEVVRTKESYGYGIYRQRVMQQYSRGS